MPKRTIKISLSLLHRRKEGQSTKTAKMRSRNLKSKRKKFSHLRTNYRNLKNLSFWKNARCSKNKWFKISKSKVYQRLFIILVNNYIERNSQKKKTDMSMSMKSLLLIQTLSTILPSSQASSLDLPSAFLTWLKLNKLLSSRSTRNRLITRKSRLASNSSLQSCHSPWLRKSTRKWVCQQTLTITLSIPKSSMKLGTLKTQSAKNWLRESPWS